MVHSNNPNRNRKGERESSEQASERAKEDDDKTTGWRKKSNGGKEQTEVAIAVECLAIFISRYANELIDQERKMQLERKSSTCRERRAIGKRNLFG